MFPNINPRSPCAHSRTHVCPHIFTSSHMKMEKEKILPGMSFENTSHCPLLSLRSLWGSSRVRNSLYLSVVCLAFQLSECFGHPTKSWPLTLNQDSSGSKIHCSWATFWTRPSPTMGVNPSIPTQPGIFNYLDTVLYLLFTTRNKHPCNKPSNFNYKFSEQIDSSMM